MKSTSALSFGHLLCLLSRAWLAARPRYSTGSGGFLCDCFPPFRGEAGGARGGALAGNLATALSRKFLGPQLCELHRSRVLRSLSHLILILACGSKLFSLFSKISKIILLASASKLVLERKNGGKDDLHSLPSRMNNVRRPPSVGERRELRSSRTRAPPPSCQVGIRGPRPSCIYPPSDSSRRNYGPLSLVVPTAAHWRPVCAACRCCSRKRSRSSTMSRTARPTRT